MELKDVINIQCFSKYLAFKNYKLNSYEDRIIQGVWPFLTDFQLAFLIKDSHVPNDMEWLNSCYHEFFSSYSSLNYPSFLLQANLEGDFWARIPVQIWKEVKHLPFQGFYDWIPIYQDTWKKFDEAFQQSVDYIDVFEDDLVRIVAFVLKLKKPFDSERPPVRVFYQSGFDRNPHNTCDVIKQEVAQEYSYEYYNAQEMIETQGINTFFQMDLYYKNQESELRRQLNLK